MVRKPEEKGLPMRTFKYSITYLAVLFGAFLVDHYLIIRASFEIVN
jgi:heme O synthase-like polyprenyltransferase